MAVPRLRVAAPGRGSHPAERQDQTLIDRCRQGDPAALDEVFRTHAPMLQRLLSRLMGPSADREDVLQETLMIAARAFPAFRGDSALSTWLSGIAIRVARRHLSRPHVRRRAEIHSLTAAQEGEDRAPAPDSVVAARRLLDRLYVHLNAMSEKKRTAFVLYAADGRSIQEISDLIGVNRLTVKSRILFARRELLARARRDPGLKELLESFEQRRELDVT